MRKQIVLLGAGAYGREIASMIRTSTLVNQWNLLGFVDSDQSLSGKVVAELSVLGTEKHLAGMNQIFVACCIGDPWIRMEVVHNLEVFGIKWATIVHPSAHIGERSSIGEGSIIFNNTILTCDIIVGKHVHINANCAIGHDAIFEDFSSAQANSSILGRARLKKGAYVGAGAVILPKVRIGEFSLVTAGSIANRHIPAHVVAGGIPARKLQCRRIGGNYVSPEPSKIYL